MLGRDDDHCEYFPIHMQADLTQENQEHSYWHVLTRMTWLTFHRSPSHPRLQSHAVCLNELSFCHTSAEVPIWRGNCWLQDIASRPYHRIPWNDFFEPLLDALAGSWPVTSPQDSMRVSTWDAQSQQVPGTPWHWRSYCSGRFRSIHYHQTGDQLLRYRMVQGRRGWGQGVGLFQTPEFKIFRMI